MHPVTSPENYGTSNQGVNYGGWRAKSYGNGRSFSDMGIDSGTTYTFSWLQWSDQVGSYPQMGFYGQLEGGSTNNFHDGRSPSHQGQLVAGVWERKSWTISSAADWKQANIPSIYCYGYIGATTAASTIRITDIQVEVKGYNTPYIDKVPLTNTYEAHRLAANGWRDISGNGKHGTLTNMVGTGTAHYKEGNIIRLGGPVTNGFNISNDPMYLDFDGTNDYVAVSSHSDKFSAWTPSGSYNNNLTIEVWVKTSDDGANIVSKPWNGNGVYNYRVISNGIFKIQTNTTAQIDVGSLTTGQWIHFVGVITPTHLYGYVNGDLKDDTSHSLTNTISNGEGNIGLLIGSLYPYGEGWSGNTGFSLDGQVAVVKIYSTALSHANIRQSYNASKSRFGL